MNAKIKKRIIVGLLLLSLFYFYFLTGVYLAYKIEISDVWGSVFNNDMPRIISDFYSNASDHYRTKVHPIYVLLIQPIVKLINVFMRNGIVSIIFFQSIIGVANICLLNYILTKITKNQNKTIG